MKNKGKTKAELLKELEILQEEREKGVFKDITESIQTEKELKDSEERLKILFDYAPDAYYINDLKGNFIDGNKAAERLMGYKKEELVGKSFLKLNLLTLTDIPRAAKLLMKNLRGQPTGPDEFVLKRKDKSKVTVEISTYPVKIKERTLVLGIARDITERKQAEEKLKKSEQKFKNIVQSLPLGIHMYKLDKDSELRFIGSNPSADKILGIDNSQYIGKTIHEAFPNISKTEIPNKFKEIAEKGGRWEKQDIIYKDNLIQGAFKNVNFQSSPGTVISMFDDITERKQAEERLKKSMNATIDTMSNIIEARDPYTSGHQHRVCQLAVSLAQEMKLPKAKIEGIRIASLIHDIGKISLPTEILSKPTKLTDIEFSLIKAHSQIGYDILKSIDFPYPIARIILQHHERINGTGYPNNLKGDEIMLEAKIIGIADVVDAMSSHRPYRPALGIDRALEEISQNKGIFYDPEVVDACLKLFKEKEFKFK